MPPSGGAHANNHFASLGAAIQQSVLNANVQISQLNASVKQASTAASVQRSQIAAASKAQQATLTANLKQSAIAANVKLANSPQFATLNAKTQQALIAANSQIAGGGPGGGGKGGAGSFNPHATVNAALGGSLTGVLSSLGPIGVSAAVLVGTFSKLAAAASPQRWATLTASVEGLEIAMGSLLLPIVDELSASFQNLTIGVRNLNKFMEKFTGKQDTQPPKGAWDWTTTTLKAAAGDARASLKLFNGLAAAAAGDEAVTPETMKKSYKGLPQPQYSSFSDYIDRLDVAGLLSNSKEADNMQKQLENSNVTAVNTGELVKLMRQQQNQAPPFRN